MYKRSAQTEFKNSKLGGGGGKMDPKYHTLYTYVIVIIQEKIIHLYQPTVILKIKINGFNSYIKKKKKYITKYA